MPEFSQTKTTWEVNAAGDIVCVNSGDPTWRTTAVHKVHLDEGLQPWKIAHLMNEAFKAGMEAKSDELRRALGVKP